VRRGETIFRLTHVGGDALRSRPGERNELRAKTKVKLVLAPARIDRESDALQEAAITNKVRVGPVLGDEDGGIEFERLANLGNQYEPRAYETPTDEAMARTHGALSNVRSLKQAQQISDLAIEDRPGGSCVELSREVDVDFCERSDRHPNLG
jgi:hypothetical protein